MKTLIFITAILQAAWILPNVLVMSELYFNIMSAITAI